MEYCTEFEALLDLYVDGELPAEDMIRVQAHLATCPDCQAYVDDLLAIRAAFPDVEDTVIPEGFAESVMAEVRKSAAPVKKTKRVSWQKVLLPLAACCAVVVLALPLTNLNGAKMESAAAPAEAPAAAAYVTYTADAAAEESVAESDDAPAETAAAPAAMDVTAKKDSSSTAGSMPEPAPVGGMGAGNSARIGAAEVTLTAEEAGTLLDAYEVVEETDEALCYHLNAEEFDSLIAALADAGIHATVSLANGDAYIVTVLK